MAVYFLPKHEGKYLFEGFMTFDELNDISEKMVKISQLLEIPPGEAEERKSICAELREALRKYYPDCQLFMYGSSINGFGSKRSLLDLLFLPYPGYSSSEYTSNKGDPIPDAASILSGEVSKDVLTKFNDWNHLKFIRNVIRKEKAQAKRLPFLPYKRPVIRVHFTNSNLVCCISGSERIFVFTSELLHLLSKLDPRVKPLVMTLVFWGRALGFVKKSFFSTYAFTLLIIFFLQNVNPPVLPSVQHLMATAGFSRMTDGWQTAFTTDEKTIPKSKNTETLGELLLHFFEYYWNFDFVQNVISPYSGKVTLVKDLKNSSDPRLAEFEVSAFNIQDPFVHSENLSKVEGPKVVFKLVLHTAHKMLQEKSVQENFFKFFDPMEYQRVFDLHFDKYMFGRPKVIFINFDFSCVANFSRTPKNLLLWYKRASEAVFDILQYGLLIDCEITDKVCWDAQSNGKQNAPVGILKNKSNVTPQGSPYDLELLLSIQCVVYSRTWIGRKNITVVSNGEDDLEDFSETALQTEYNISKKLVTTNPTLTTRHPLLCLKCDCYRHTCPQISDVVVLLKPLTLSKEYSQIAGFLGSFLPRTVKKILSS